ncbi:MAG: hypothetical protein K2X28_01930 [Alphaproteobacteria bacterium]|nr:hypothetical protein [Alphaproteobacteria bacterium]
MKRIYKKSKRLLQASSLLALPLGSPLKAEPFESLVDRATRAVAIKLATDHPIEQGNLSSYVELIEKVSPNTASAIVHHLPEDTRRGLLRSIGELSDTEFTLQHKLLVSSVFEALQKDQIGSLELSFNENQIMGSHRFLGSELINLNRFFGDAASNYFSTLEVKVNVDDTVKNPDILSRLSQSKISRLKLAMSQESSEVEKAEKLSTFFQSGWDQLLALDISHNHIGAAGATVIANSPTLTNLQSLNLAFNDIGDNGVIAIANSQILTNLQSLNLDTLDINDLQNSLKLSFTGISDAGVTAIADSQILKNLLSLSLVGNYIDTAVTAIAKSQTLTKLQNLNLAATSIGADEAIAIANSQNLKNLLNLNLAFNYIDDEGGMAIANSQTLKNLHSLNLCDNTIRKGGAIAIAKSQTLTKLQILNLKHTSIGRDGVAAIVNSPTLEKLQILNLSRNNIDDVVARVITGSQTLKNLENLNLASNHISEAEMTAMRNSPIFANTRIEF